MVKFLIERKHAAMLEHGTVYLTINCGLGEINILNKYLKNKYTKVNLNGGYSYITTNYRVLVENNWLDDLQYQCEPTEYHEKRVSVRFICDRAIAMEYIRHRVFSFAQESTRYCNYTKDKFSSEITFIIPCWLGLKEDTYIENKYGLIENLDTNLDRDSFIFVHNLCGNERYYFNLMQYGWKPQQARAVLPNALKTELIMTGFISDWKHFFHLRTAKGAHPQAQELAIPLQEEFKKIKFNLNNDNSTKIFSFLV